jgi:RNA polymerase sigma-70 factor (ECF subfamily)
MRTIGVELVEDRRLVDGLAHSGREVAFRALADRHLDASYRLAHAILGQRAEAEDATHDAFITAWRNWSRLRDPELFERWFHRILVNTCRNRLRQISRGRQFDGAALPPMAADAYGPTHDRDLLWPAMERLAPDHRVVLALRYYGDLSVDQIAARIGVRAGTVKSRLHRALQALRTELDQADPERMLR